MADDETPAGKAGPWDVLMYFAQRWPTVVLGVGLVGGSIYLVWRFSEKAERSQEKLAETVEKAAEVRLAAATEVQKQLQASNESLLEIAKSVQALVAGQIANMQEMEKLRADHTARVGALQEQEEKSRKEKLEAQIAEVLTKLREAQGALVRRTIQKLQEGLKKNEFGAMADARRTLRSLGTLQDPEIAELKRIAAESSDRRVKLVALEMLAHSGGVEATDETEFGRLVWEHRAELESDERRFVFSPDDLTPTTFRRRVGLAMRFLEEPGATRETRTDALGYFRSMPLGDRPAAFFADTKSFLRVLRWHREAIFDPAAREYEASSLLWSVSNLEAAACHVWVQEFLKSGASAATKQEVERSAASMRRGTVSFSAPVAPALREFWMEPDLEKLAADYPARGTSAEYR